MKEDNINKMDRILQEKFSEFEGQPSPSSKDTIFKEWRASKKKDSKLFLFVSSKQGLLAIAASLLVILCAALMLLGKPSSGNPQIASAPEPPDTFAPKHIPGDTNKNESTGSQESTIIREVTKPDLVKYKTRDKIMTVFLPDSSKVYINKNSSLSYISDSFGRATREVTLTGEAYFDITSGSGKPFIIQAKKSRIGVLGTSFNVKCTETSEEVVVEEGKVVLMSKSSPGDKVVLREGEKGIVDSGNKVYKEKSINENDLSWKTKRLVFANTPMKEVIFEIEKYFGIQIEVDERKIFKCLYTGKFEDPTKEKVLKIISLSIHGSYQETDNKYLLVGKGCK